MSRAEELWEKLVHAALRREITDDEIAENVSSKSREIDEILRVADEVQDKDPTISRILCEHAYSLSHKLDRNKDGVLQFKTAIMSVMKQRAAKREIGSIDRKQEFGLLQEFYESYRKKNNTDELCEEEMQNLELDCKAVKREVDFAVLKVLETVLEQLSEEISKKDAIQPRSAVAIVTYPCQRRRTIELRRSRVELQSEPQRVESV
ncbi:unnamed protein product [Vicia faba]|uniref:Uncharacterized protein n=1 Tax=Vicia faba TaxID=3906 RepID=A0AAV0ZT66_VICFA|nr:unnamed protein product [Vicia faba]